MINHPGTLARATPPQRGTLFRDGTGVAVPSVVKGDLDRNWAVGIGAFSSRGYVAHDMGGG